MVFQLDNISDYAFAMLAVSIYAGINFAFLYLPSISMIVKKEFALVTSLVYSAICFLTYNFLAINGLSIIDLFGLLAGFSSFLALIFLQFLTEPATRATKRWKATFIAYITFAIITTVVSIFMKVSIPANMEGYGKSMIAVFILVGLNFTWLYASTFSLVTEKRKLSVISIIVTVVCFFTYNYLEINGLDIVEPIVFIFGFSSFIAIFLLQFETEPATREGWQWKTSFIIHVVAAILMSLYFVIN